MVSRGQGIRSEKNRKGILGLCHKGIFPPLNIKMFENLTYYIMNIHLIHICKNTNSIIVYVWPQFYGNKNAAYTYVADKKSHNLGEKWVIL